LGLNIYMRYLSRYQGRHNVNVSLNGALLFCDFYLFKNSFISIGNFIINVKHKVANAIRAPF